MSKRASAAIVDSVSSLGMLVGAQTVRSLPTYTEEVKLEIQVRNDAIEACIVNHVERTEQALAN